MWYNGWDSIFMIVMVYSQKWSTQNINTASVFDPTSYTAWVYIYTTYWGNIHVLRNHKKGEVGVRKEHFLITFITKSNHKGKGRKTLYLDYVKGYTLIRYVT
jgi:hypothetical protein